MRDFKTAEEAYKETKKNSEKLLEKELDEILKAINNAIRQEKYSVTVKSLSPTMIGFLRDKMKYRVSQKVEDMRRQVFSISWAHIGK